MSVSSVADSVSSSADQVCSHESTSGEILELSRNIYHTRSTMKIQPHPIIANPTMRYSLCVFVCVCLWVCFHAGMFAHHP